MDGRGIRELDSSAKRSGRAPRVAAPAAIGRPRVTPAVAAHLRFGQTAEIPMGLALHTLQSGGRPGAGKAASSTKKRSRPVLRSYLAVRPTRCWRSYSGPWSRGWPLCRKDLLSRSLGNTVGEGKLKIFRKKLLDVWTSDKVAFLNFDNFQDLLRVNR